MKNVRKLDLSKKMLRILLLSGVSLSLTGCQSTKKVTDSYSFDELLNNEEVQVVTLMDELLEEGSLYYNDMSLLEAVNQLEEYMNIVDKVSNYKDFSYDTEYNFEDIHLEKVEELISLTKSKDSTEKKNASRVLSSINAYCSDWIYNNGGDISIQLMMAAVKSGLADELEMTASDYDTIKIDSKEYSDDIQDYTIIVGDDSYKVPSKEKEIWNTIDYIYRVQDADFDSINQKKAFETYRKAIVYAKITLMAGVDVKKGKVESQYDVSYINKHYSK